jgi:nucleoside-diphosphate-sugar epimerase
VERHRGSMQRKAFVVGALGVVGRGLINHLLGLPEWEVVALSRRPIERRARLRTINVDLLDHSCCEAALVGLKDVTHVFYVAYAPRPTHAEEVEPNLRMLQNLMEALEPVALDLQHVTLMQGTKAYGAHLGPYKTPARETDLRIISPLFYYPQQDYLSALAHGKAWKWSVMRPRCIWGFSIGSTMNMITALAVYAAISRELGLPLCFPGTEGGYRRIEQAVDTELLAKACVWVATEPRCANQIFNVANGGLFRWQDMWPRIAEVLGMSVGPIRNVRLTEAMADKGPLWSRIVETHGLQPLPYEQLVDWSFADFQWRMDYDHISDTTKLFRYGFREMVDDEEMIVRMLRHMQQERIIP